MSDRVKELWNGSTTEAVLVSDGYNMRYLSGFQGATGYLFLSCSRKVLLTDSRYTTQAREEAVDFEIIEAGAGAGYGDILTDLIQQTKVTGVIFEDLHMIYADFMRLKEKCGDIKWIEAGDRLNRLRLIKTEEELSSIAQAEAIGDKVFKRILEEIKPGVTELEIAAKIEYYMKEEGASGTSFDTIVASGLHSAMPHAIPSEKRIEKGDFITMDFGCVYEGYCSDMTRTVVVGKANEKQRKIYGIVLEAQKAALAVIKEGLTGSQIDAVARDIIEKAGYGGNFGHGLGHGVGLFIHEEPRLSPKCHEVLKEGMIQTVEPGIYIPGFGGVRIEDLVAITKEGCKNFTYSPKELIEL